MSSLLEAWTDSGVNRSDNMLSSLICADFYNDENEMEKPEVDNVEEYQTSVMKKPKVDEVEEYQASVTLKKQ